MDNIVSNQSTLTEIIKNKRNGILAFALLLLIGFVLFQVVRSNRIRNLTAEVGSYYQIQDQVFPIKKDEFDVFVLRCIAGKTKYKTFVVNESLTIFSAVECYYSKDAYIYVPLSFYDNKSDTQYYWTLNPIKTPTLSNIERRAEARIARVLFSIPTTSDNDLLLGQHFAVSYGQITDKNLQLFNVSQIIQNLSFDKESNTKNVLEFVSTGKHNNSMLLIPLSVDQAVYQIKQ